MDTLAKEMTNVCIAFKILDDGVDPPPGYQFMSAILSGISSSMDSAERQD